LSRSGGGGRHHWVMESVVGGWGRKGAGQRFGRFKVGKMLRGGWAWVVSGRVGRREFMVCWCGRERGLGSGEHRCVRGWVMCDRPEGEEGLVMDGWMRSLKKFGGRWESGGRDGNRETKIFGELLGDQKGREDRERVVLVW